MFIYGLVDPIDQTLRYVGQAVDANQRWIRHLSDRARTRKTSWIKGLAKLGLKPELVILDEVAFDAANVVECFWIASLRATGAGLYNMGNGGERVTFTPEVRAKMRAAQLARRADPDWRAEQDLHLAKGRTPEARKKQAIAKLGKPGIPRSPETRAKISASHKARHA